MRGRLLILIGLVILLAVIVGVVLLGRGGRNLGGSAPPVPTDGGEPSLVIPTAGPTPTPISFVRIAITLQNLPRGYQFPNRIEELTDVVAYFPWPEEAVPFNALREDQGGLEFVLGKIARTDLFREQPLLSNLLVDSLANIANVGSDAAAVLPSDRVAVAIPVNRQTSVAYAIREGDRVDVIISMLFVDVDEIFQTISPNNITLFSIKDDGTIEFVSGLAGRPDQTTLGPAIIGASERQRPRLVTQRTIQDALVLRVGDFPLIGDYIGVPPTPTPIPDDASAQDGAAGATPVPPTPIPLPDIVTLGVTPQYADFLVWAIEAKLPLTLALRSATDTSRVPTQPVTLDYIMNEFRIDLPARRDYTIEPAITSIRKLVAGDEISLTGVGTTP